MRQSKSDFVNFFFNDTATTEIYTLSLHDALPICGSMPWLNRFMPSVTRQTLPVRSDRKSTRLNSSHGSISYAVFCLKKKHFNLGLCPIASQLQDLASVHPTVARE